MLAFLRLTVLFFNDAPLCWLVLKAVSSFLVSKAVCTSKNELLIARTRNLVYVQSVAGCSQEVNNTRKLKYRPPSKVTEVQHCKQHPEMFVT
ncbi:hypothetical protein WN51_14227 [Melipona quadrifasciata]|uniref:Secreted protein n=1 Tax=Melipona quadrifasciata TaxID=166423 RepID=A0A0M8ZZL0_9HYME|nr:hypothetical protein WN51_14227 [Melipona quadrifasciata]